MDKTVSISLGGFSFIMDEIAYKKLKIYLEDIKKSLRGTDSIDDIIEDIEIRIAELFRERLQYREVVNENDVDAIIETMGHPDQYIYEEEDSTKNESNYKSQSNESLGRQQIVKKKLFRDSDDSIISGLSSGLSYYLGVDPWFIRAIWLILGVLGIFTQGVSLVLVLFCYFILLIFVPKAITTSQKLQMYGQPTNIDTLKKNIEKTSEAVVNGSRGLSNGLADFFQIFGRIILVFIGFVIFIVGLSLIIGGFFITFKTFANIPTQLFGYLIEEKWMSILARILAGILVVIPGILLTILAIKCFWNKAKVSKKIITSSIIVWLIALFGTTIIFVITSSKFNDSVEVIDKKVFNIPSDTLNIDFKKEDEGYIKYNSFNDLNQLIDDKGDLVIGKDKKFEIEESNDNNFHLEIKYSSEGGNTEESKRNLEAIKYNYEISGDKLIFDNLYKIVKTGKFRNQKVDLKLYVPKNKILAIKEAKKVKIINKNSESENLYDLKNNLIKYNGKKIVCLNCTDNKYFDDDDYGINVKDGEDEAKVIINEHGIRIQTNKKKNIENTKQQIHYKDDTDSININYGSHSEDN